MLVIGLGIFLLAWLAISITAHLFGMSIAERITPLCTQRHYG